MELFHGKVWKDREQAFADTMARYNSSEQDIFSEMMAMLVEALEHEMTDVLGQIYMETGKPDEL